jgi:hypothetical protein
MSSIFSIITHGIVAIISMVVLHYFMGYSNATIVNFFNLNYVNKSKIWYGGTLLSRYDENCSVVIENEFKLIKLYCSSKNGRKKLFRVWERGIAYQPPLMH